MNDRSKYFSIFYQYIMKNKQIRKLNLCKVAIGKEEVFFMKIACSNDEDE